jgi:hypothetical protein
MLVTLPFVRLIDRIINAHDSFSFS